MADKQVPPDLATPNLRTKKALVIIEINTPISLQEARKISCAPLYVLTRKGTSKMLFMIQLKKLIRLIYELAVNFSPSKIILTPFGGEPQLVLDNGRVRIKPFRIIKFTKRIKVLTPTLRELKQAIKFAIKNKYRRIVLKRPFRSITTELEEPMSLENLLEGKIRLELRSFLER